MKETIFNRTRIEGRLYQNKLTQKITGPKSKQPGTPFISGEIEIATDEAITNIVSVHFTYVTATTSKGTPNATYNILNDIAEGRYKTVMNDGAQVATKIAVDSAIGLNEFFSTRNGTEELISAKRNEGGFVRILNELNKNENARASFDTDIVIYKFRKLDADEEKSLSERGIVSGYIMNFRKDFLPVDFTVLNPAAIDYFEGLEVSEKNPVFTRVRGKQISQSIVQKYTEEGAFGEAYVREFSRSHKDFVITWAKTEPYNFEDGGDITAEDIKKGLADRQTTVATIKKNQEEWRANSANEHSAFSGAATPRAATAAEDTFEF